MVVISHWETLNMTRELSNPQPASSIISKGHSRIMKETKSSSSSRTALSNHRLIANREGWFRKVSQNRERGQRCHSKWTHRTMASTEKSQRYHHTEEAIWSAILSSIAIISKSSKKSESCKRTNHNMSWMAWPSSQICQKETTEIWVQTSTTSIICQTETTSSSTTRSKPYLSGTRRLASSTKLTIWETARVSRPNCFNLIWMDMCARYSIPDTSRPSNKLFTTSEERTPQWTVAKRERSRSHLSSSSQSLIRGLDTPQKAQ